MSFNLIMNYKKNADVRNLVYRLDDSFRQETFNGILDYLDGVKPQLKTNDQKILNLALSYRKKHREYLEEERNTGKHAEFSLIVTLINKEGEKIDLREQDPVFDRPITNLDQKITDYIRTKFLKQPGGKELAKDILPIMFDYIPLIGHSEAI